IRTADCLRARGDGPDLPSLCAFLARRDGRGGGKAVNEWWGIDVGGANIKWVDSHGQAGSRYFPLWQRPADLAEELADILGGLPGECGLAATMTGELCDCFETKAEGVLHIVAALWQASGETPLALYGVD